jgi:hypothetical protein
MHISIWQQWASNHSGGFTLVGVFETPKAAERAKDEICKLLQAIRNEHYGEPVDAPLYNDTKVLPPSISVEQQIARHFDIEWPHHVEWVDDGEFFGDDTITQVGSIVFVHAYSWAFQGPSPLDIIMDRLGAARVSCESYSCKDHEDVFLLFSIECEVPTPERAEWLELMFQDFKSPGTSSPLNGLVDAYAHEILPYDLIHNQVVREGAKLSFTNLRLGEITYLPRFLKWLESEDCTNISYDFVEVRPSQEE